MILSSIGLLVIFRKKKISPSSDSKKLKIHCFKEDCAGNFSVDGETKELLLKRGTEGFYKSNQSGRRPIDNSVQNITQGVKKEEDCIKCKREADSQNSLLK